MKWLLSILALVFAVEVHAQPSPINRRAMIISGLATRQPDITDFPVLKNGIYLRWVASDIPVGATVSNQWADRIQGLIEQNGDASTRPTNSSLGVWFSGSSGLTNVDQSSKAIEVPFALLMVVRREGTVAANSVILNDTGATPPQYGGYLLTSSGTQWNVQVSTLSIVDLKATLADQVFQDACVIPTNASGQQTFFYTNGVRTSASTFTENVTGSFQLNAMGWDRLKANKFKGYIAEVVFWTNAIANFSSWDSTVRSNLHYYCTNTYKFSP